MKKQQGFTLIELVMVIVILGILSAFALPRFADLGEDAKLASLKGAFGAVKSASAIAHAKALTTGQTGVGDDDAALTVDLDGVNIDMKYGYPTQDESGIVAAAQLSEEFDFDKESGEISLEGLDCSFTYVAPTEAGKAPQISYADGCGV